MLTNALKINAKTLNLTSDSLLRCLKENLTEEIFPKVSSVYSFYTKKYWIVEFDKSFNVSQLFEKKIILNDGTELTLDNSNYVKPKIKQNVRRFHRVPSSISKTAISNFLYALNFSELNILESKEETYKDFPQIKNGVIRFKISYPPVLDNQIQNLAGPVKIVISIVGQKPKWYFCLDLSHTFKNCQKRNTICINCNNKGHSSERCSIVERIKSSELKNSDFGDIELDDNELSESWRVDYEENRQETTESLGKCITFDDLNPFTVPNSIITPAPQALASDLIGSFVQDFSNQILNVVSIDQNASAQPKSTHSSKSTINSSSRRNSVSNTKIDENSIVQKESSRPSTKRVATSTLNEQKERKKSNIEDEGKSSQNKSINSKSTKVKNKQS
ncbi:unnamed protein product [Brachionus calyciflorus]|uniref:CCHC-type domain-containing protein n=1 Tax=Brachionus calyciflorus TaxID=104777 RepID=A0A814PPN5_9BILA|nr:unnamed protein product [Brachionus calyciflorus]